MDGAKVKSLAHDSRQTSCLLVLLFLFVFKFMCIVLSIMHVSLRALDLLKLE